MNVQNAGNLSIRESQQAITQGENNTLEVQTQQIINSKAMPLTCTAPLETVAFAAEAETLAAICAYSTLNKAEKLALLAFKNNESEPALHLAARNGHTECALNMIEVIVSSSLPQAEKIELLAAKNSFGVPALHWAAEQGDDALLGSFLTAFERIGMSAEEQIALLAPKSEAESVYGSSISEQLAGLAEERNKARRYQSSALDWAAKNGHDKCFQLLVAQIEQFAISDSEKMQLLSTAFCLAARSGFIACMHQLLDISDKLTVPIEERVKWFAYNYKQNYKKEYFDYSVLRYAHRHYECIPTIMEAIDKLDISNEEKIALVISKDVYDCSAFHFGMASFSEEFAQSYLTALMNMKLPDTLKLAVFKSTYYDNSATPLHYAAQTGIASYVRLLIEAIEKLDISPQEKIALLEAKDMHGIPALHIAVKNGRTECVELLISAMCRQQISEEQREKLTEIKQYLHSSMAFCERIESEASDPFEDLLPTPIQCFAAKAASFSEEEQAALLATKPKKTETAESKGYYDDDNYDLNSAFFLRYLNYVDNLEVSDEEKQQLLEAKDCFGAPALFWLAHSPSMLYEDLCIDALIDSMFEATGSDEEVCAMLDVRGSYDSCALEFAGRYSGLRYDMYGIIASLEIPSEKKMAMLVGNNSEGSPILHRFENEHHGYDVCPFKDVVSTIVWTNTSDTEKATLLEAKNAQGVPVLHALAEKGYSDQLQTLADAIIELNISNQEKIRLLEGKNSQGLSAVDAAALYETQEERDKDCGQDCIKILTGTIDAIKQPRASCRYPVF